MQNSAVYSLWCSCYGSTVARLRRCCERGDAKRRISPRTKRVCRSYRVVVQQLPQEGSALGTVALTGRCLQQRSDELLELRALQRPELPMRNLAISRYDDRKRQRHQ